MAAIRGARLLQIVLILSFIMHKVFTLADPDLQAGAQTFVQKGMRRLSLDLSMAEDSNYELAFAKAKSVGADSVGLSFDWSDIESRPKIYFNSYLKIADDFYPHKNVSVDLTLRPLHANRKCLPEDLVNTSFDDPEMISRFQALLDYVFSQTRHICYSSIVIGSEVNLFFPRITPPRSLRLNSDSGVSEDISSERDRSKRETTAWDQYTVFCKSIAQYVRAAKPGVKVAFEATYYGLVDTYKERLKELNTFSDIVGVSYYPINSDYSVKSPETVTSDFQRLTTVYPGQKIAFYQLGYPSSSLLASSEEKQAAFVGSVFKAWDQHASQIELIDFTYLTDCSEKEIAAQMIYFNQGGNRFAEFLRTLGFRRYAGSGSDKPAFLALQREAKARGW